MTLSFDANDTTDSSSIAPGLDYTSTARRMPVMSRATANALSAPSMEGDVGARNRLIEGNLRLVLSIASHYRTAGVDFSDLVSEGNLGLIRAAEKFDARKGHAFSTYATWWIRYRISRYLGQQATLLSWPISDQKLYAKLHAEARRMVQALGREPTTAMVADAAGACALDAERVMGMANAVVSLDRSLSTNDGDDGSFYEILPQGDVGAEQRIETSDSYRALERIISGLPQRYATVMRERFGLNDVQEPLSLQRIGDKMGITRERVRQIERSALQALREHMRAEGLALGDFV